jgi:tetratricopeptide (TPR) repeat protein
LAPAVVIEPEPEIDWAALAAERARVIADIDEQIAEAGEALRTARFRFGLIALEEVRVALGNLEAGDDLSSLHVRLETLAAIAHVALGQQTEALESLLRALDADPDLALDPLTTSPKVLRALRLARATRVRSVEAE